MIYGECLRAGLTGCIRGFGYDYATDDYKVVRIYKQERAGVIVRRTLVYSLRLGLWRATSKDYTGDFSIWDLGIYMNGALCNGIFVFDLGIEDYVPILIPRPNTLHSSASFERLNVLGGRLVYSSYDYGTKCLRVWTMNAGCESWVEWFSIGRMCADLKPVAYLESKGMVLLEQTYDARLLWIDMANKRVKQVTFDELVKFSCYQFCPGSLLRLGNGNTRAGVKRKTAQERLMCRVELTGNFIEVGDSCS